MMHVVQGGEHPKKKDRAKHWSKVTFTVEEGRCGADGGQIFFVIIRRSCIFVSCNCWKNVPRGVIGDVPKNLVYNACCYMNHTKFSLQRRSLLQVQRRSRMSRSEGKIAPLKFPFFISVCHNSNHLTSHTIKPTITRLHQT